MKFLFCFSNDFNTTFLPVVQVMKTDQMTMLNIQKCSNFSHFSYFFKYSITYKVN